jgi:hypothetical protein
LFRERIQRVDEIPEAPNWRLVIARSGARSTSHSPTKSAISPPETLDDLPRALVAAGQVTIVRANGERAYQAVL